MNNDSINKNDDMNDMNDMNDKNNKNNKNDINKMNNMKEKIKNKLENNEKLTAFEVKNIDPLDYINDFIKNTNINPNEKVSKEDFEKLVNHFNKRYGHLIGTFSTDELINELKNIDYDVLNDYFNSNGYNLNYLNHNNINKSSPYHKQQNNKQPKQSNDLNSFYKCFKVYPYYSQSNPQSNPHQKSTKNTKSSQKILSKDELEDILNQAMTIINNEHYN